ncbi:conserved hypothetical protein [Ricinus communis]|uniref:Uncharacterized protein n=1 Tax=Ricinus communis TaxID=3988 RepID=B9RVG3_RICCO|nr:conserved hypothetical protein [Ricinus communis]
MVGIEEQQSEIQALQEEVTTIRSQVQDLMDTVRQQTELLKLLLPTLKTKNATSSGIAPGNGANTPVPPSPPVTLDFTAPTIEKEKPRPIICMSLWIAMIRC